MATGRGIRADSLGRWILIRLALLLLVLGSIFCALSVYLLDMRFDTFDAEYYRQELLRVQIALDQDRQSMSALASDYGRWDDTERYVAGENEGFIDTNYTADSLANIRMSLYAITGNKGELIRSQTLDHDRNLIDTPAAEIARLRPFLAEAIKAVGDNASTTLVWLPGPRLLATSPITDTARKHSATGYMFFLRELDEAYLNKMRAGTSSNFKLVAAAAGHEAKSSIEQGYDRNGERWTVSRTLPDWPAAIKVGGPTQLGNERRLAYVTIAVNALLLVLASLGGIYTILNRRVLSRLKTFSTLADRHRLQREDGIRWPITGADELDNLGESLNGLMAEVETQHGSLRYLADHDSLTGIGNRRVLLARLEAVLNRSHRTLGLATASSNCLLLLDLDGFKAINDGLGHAAGDHVLRTFADRIVTLARNYDTVARIGGDEFAVLLEDVSLANAEQFALRLLAMLAQPISYASHSLTVAASIGIAPVAPTLFPEDILRNADIAMYEAKHRGKGQVTIFDIGLLDAAARKMQLGLALKLALDHDELAVWFQPIVNSGTGAVVGVEALSRWRLDGNFIGPDEFIAIAEDTALIGRLGRSVIERSAAALQDLQREHPQLSCSVNLSVAQFKDEDLVSTIDDCFSRYGIPAAQVNLELTESMLIESASIILPRMRRLIELGYRFHLDDFGTGYSSLDRLRDLPFHTLKIDRSFITRLRAGDDVMARNIISMGRGLGMTIIAEGVEEAQEYEQLRQMGCTLIQGYYIARPMPLDELRSWLNQRPCPADGDLSAPLAVQDSQVDFA